MSFGINSWRSSRKGEKTATKERSGKDSRVIEWWKRESIFRLGVLRKCTNAKRQRKRGLERFFKSWMPGIFVEGNCFGTPLYTTCKSEQGW